MKRTYESWRPGEDALAIVAQANLICADYRSQGYDLTLRQLYYQFVAKALIPNNDKSYKRLGDIVNRARLAGLLDWNYIVDRTRNLRGWDWPGNTPEEAIRATAEGFTTEKWATQPVRIEIWVEKDALAGVIERSANRWDVNYFACRGYVSQSELWSASQRLLRYVEGGQRVVILHLGDHDPSGIDMTRDITDRARKFAYSDWWRSHDIDGATYGAIANDMNGHLSQHGNLDLGDPIEVRRIALNMDQIDEYAPPPNPAKITDSRAINYIERYGEQSWELDALDPATLNALIDEHIAGLRDEEKWDAAVEIEEQERLTLTAIADNYDDIATEYGPDNS